MLKFVRTGWWFEVNTGSNGAAVMLDRSDEEEPQGVLRLPTSGRRAALSIAGFWGFYYGLNTARVFLIQGTVLGGLLPRAIVAALGIGLSSLLYAVLRPFDQARMWRRLVVASCASVPVAFAYSAANFYVFKRYQPGLWAMIATPAAKAGHSMLMLIVNSAIEWYFFIAAWAVVYIALSNSDQLRLAERKAAQYQAEAQAAQLRALRYQINPHFLFNALNSISALALRNGDDEGDRVIIALSTFLRLTLSSDPTADVTLADELKMQSLYLEIEKARFPDRLQVALNVPRELEDALVPNLILQPVIENAIKFGVSRSAQLLTIRIAANYAGDRLCLTVSDDGPGTESASPGLGVGLRNVRDRLTTRYSEAATLQTGSLQTGGFRVVMTMPLLRG